MLRQAAHKSIQLAFADIAAAKQQKPPSLSLP
jgi:hypothetical protein